MKPSLLVVGPTYTIAVNRQKLWALASHFEVTCATSILSDRPVFGRPISEFDQAEPEPITVLRFREYPASARNTRIVYLGLRRALRGRSFDLVLVESEPWALLKWQAWLLTRLFQPRAKFGEFSWENVERPGWKGHVLSWVYRVTAQASDFVICGNKACREIFLRHGFDSSRAFVGAQLGVDVTQFSPKNSSELQSLRQMRGLPEKGYLVGFCGRFETEKGVLDLVEAIRSLREEFPEIELALQGAGTLLPGLEGANLAWLHLFQPVRHFEVPDFLRAIDVLVLPSNPVRSKRRVWEEQFGHVLIEAMACGTLALGSDSGAIPEVLGDSDAIFPHSDVSELIKLLRRVRTDPLFRQALVDRQSRRVTEYFTHEKVAAAYAKFLLPLLEVR